MIFGTNGTKPRKASYFIFQEHLNCIVSSTDIYLPTGRREKCFFLLLSIGGFSTKVRLEIFLEQQITDCTHFSPMFRFYNA